MRCSGLLSYIREGTCGRGRCGSHGRDDVSLKREPGRIQLRLSSERLEDTEEEMPQGEDNPRQRREEAGFRLQRRGGDRRRL